MKKPGFQTKLKAFIIGKHDLKQRFAEAFLSALALSFILFLFGPIDLSRSAEDFLSFTTLDILPECLKWWGIIFIVLFLCSWLSGGRVHSWIVSTCTGLTMAFYIQFHWLNPDLGVLDGSKVSWEEYADSGLIDLVIFCFILIVPHIIHFFSRKVWRRFIILICTMLTLMQAIPLGMMLFDECKQTSSTRYYFSKEDEFVLGSEENIIVFILDWTCNEYMQMAFDSYPEIFEPFHDFIFFDNMNTQSAATFPAAAYYLTHQIFDFENETPEEYFYRAWHNDETEAFYSQMRENDWDIYVYTDIQNVLGRNREYAYGKFSNAVQTDKQGNYTVTLSVFKKLIYLSFYRYFPVIMKSPYRLGTFDLEGMIKTPEEESDWNGFDSIEKFWENGVVTGSQRKTYRSYHYIGSHFPYKLNQWGHLTERVSETDTIKQLAGHFSVIAEYIHYLKDLELYDSSTLIITTDHGTDNDPSAIFFIKPAGRRFWKMQTSHAPITQGEYMETIAQAAGLPKGQFGRSVFEIPEDEKTMRCTYIRDLDENFPPPAPRKHDNVMIEYCSTGDVGDIKQMIRNHEGRTIYNPHSYY